MGGNDYLGSEGGGRAEAGTGEKQGRPGSMFGFWRIPSIDDSVAEEREEVRRGGNGGGWPQGEGDGEVSSSLLGFLPSHRISAQRQTN